MESKDLVEVPEHFMYELFHIPLDDIPSAQRLDENLRRSYKDKFQKKLGSAPQKQPPDQTHIPVQL